MAEQRTHKPKVEGSSPSLATNQILGGNTAHGTTCGGVFIKQFLC